MKTPDGLSNALATAAVVTLGLAQRAELRRLVAQGEEMVAESQRELTEMLALSAQRETLQATLRDGTTGFYMRRGDDCWQAALATCLQIPLSDVPDFRIDERQTAGETPQTIAESAWRELKAWLASRGLRMVAHRKPPVRRSRWIGIIHFEGWFCDHCVVMSGRDFLFDPITGPHSRDLYATLEIEDACPDLISYGYSFQSRPEEP